ncbi:MAG: methyltransferase domain-containing protein [Bacilli bacterium]|nr:methyltransferase domain-containing protein [Bacilli bacterium]
MKKYNCDEIKRLSYTDFISLIKEENRPSGGKKTIREIAINSFINCDSKVLEIGCTNGFSSLEINKLTGCSAVGIDINKNSIKNANEKIKLNKLSSKNIKFCYGNAEDLTKFDDNSFDLIICGNAISFIENKEKAFKEIIRVLKPNGFISLVPIWYKKKPNNKIISEVNKELGFKIKCYYENDWLNFDKYNIELYYKKDYSFIYASDKEIIKYVNKMIDSKKHLEVYNEKEIKCIKNRWINTIRVFNKNLAQTNYSIILLRKNLIEEEPEIFLTKEA